MYKITGRLFSFFLRFYTNAKPVKFPDAVRIQKKTLLKLLRTAAMTKFGADHGFDEITSVHTYQNNVPIRDYQAFWTQYWEKNFPALDNVTWPGPIVYFARTSGTTTGKSKFIPCSAEMVKSNNNAGLQVVIEHIRNKPDSKVLQGRTFLFAGSPELDELKKGVFAGELSGIAARETPSWAGRDRYFPPDDLARIKDWGEKLEKISVNCLNKDIRAISGLPSWLQILIDKIFANSPTRGTDLKSYFPDLELIVHGGMSFKPYNDYFSSITRNSGVDIREVYAASEGFFAIADRNFGEGLKLIVNNGIFYEFIKPDEISDINAKRYWLENIEENTDYAIVVTTNAGLWSYVVGDIVKFTDKKNLRILFSGRLSQTLSVFGETIVNEELEAAIALATKKLGLNFHDFAVGSIFEKEATTKGRHKYIIEFKEALDDEYAQKLAKIIDRELIKNNSSYATRRKNEISILSPTVIWAPNGTFAKWMKKNGKMGGQNKVPRVLNQQQLDEFLHMLSSA